MHQYRFIDRKFEKIRTTHKNLYGKGVGETPCKGERGREMGGGRRNPRGKRTRNRWAPKRHPSLT
jgi:hypothetical protein